MKFIIFYIAAISLSSAATFNNRKTKLLPQGRIRRGQKAAEGQFPYMVGLYLQKDLAIKKYDLCGGSVISNEWILTAAHCTENIKQAYVYLGATNIRFPKVRHFVSSKSFIEHFGYDSTTFENDIALIKIPFTNYTTKIQPVRLPSFASINDTYTGYIADACGWGETSFYSDKSADHLQWEVIENSLCAKTYGPQETSNICIATDTGISPYAGDSGGPLVLKFNNTQIGVASRTLEDEKDIPFVLTRTTSCLEWIKEHTGISY